MLAIFKKELRTYFLTPSGYIFMSLFLLISGVLVSFNNVLTMSPRFSSFVGSVLFIFIIAVPMLTMRLFTDERRMRTDQLLLTVPVKISNVVIGKFLAAFVLFAITVLITALYAVVLSFFGEIDVRETIGAYIGFLLLGGAFISIGIFVSATTENQVIAAVVTFGAVLIFWLMDTIIQAVPNDATAGFIFAAVIAVGVTIWIFVQTKSLLISIITIAVTGAIVLLVQISWAWVYIGFIGKVLGWFSLITRYQSFTTGILKLDAIVYYLSFTAFFLFLTLRLIEKKRWS